MLIQNKLGVHPARHATCIDMRHALDDIIAQRFPGGDAPHVAMNYESYANAIVAQHKVQLVGWTMCGGQITNPGSMPMPEARALYDAIIKQAVRWEIVSEGGDGNPDSIAPAPKKRKQRSNKGVPRGPRTKAAKTSDGADAPSSSAARKKKAARRAGSQDRSSSDSGDDSA